MNTNKTNPKIDKKAMIDGLLIFAVFLSFCLASWYYCRGILASFGVKLLANEIVAALFGGIITSLIFFFINESILRKALSSFRLSIQKLQMSIRIHFLLANLVVFGLSFLYFAFPPLYVWGRILIPFLVYLVFYVFFLAINAKKLPDKTMIASFLSLMGGTFLFVFSALSILMMILGVA